MFMEFGGSTYIESHISTVFGLKAFFDIGNSKLVPLTS